MFKKTTNKINPLYHHATQGAKVNTIKTTVPSVSAKEAYIFVGKKASNSCLRCACLGSLGSKKIIGLALSCVLLAYVSTVKTVFRIHANNIDKAYIVLVKMPSTAV